MSKELVISATPHETRVAILEDGHLCEIYIEREKEFALVGSIYKGRVTRVLPGMQSAFVDIGRDTDAFLYVSDFLENLEEYDSPGEEALPRPVSQPPAAPVAVHAAHHAPAPQAHHLEPLPGEHLAVAETTDATAEPVAPTEVLATAEALPGAAPAAPAESQEEPSDPPQPIDNSSPALATPRHLQQRPHGAPRHERGFGGGYGGRERGDRGDRGGRWRGRGGRGHHGRDLPPSKYAAPQARDRGSYRERGAARHTEAPSAPATGSEPILLPGESLAKYKDRAAPYASTPASSVPAPAVNTPSTDPAAVTAPEATPTASPAHTQSALPESLYTRPMPLRPHEYAAPEDVSDVNLPAETPTYEAGIGEVWKESGPLLEEPEELPGEAEELRAEAELQASEPSAASAELPHDLSEEQAATLASSLAEAKHEETAATAPLAHVVGGVELEENGLAAEETEETPEAMAAAEEEEEEAEAASDEEQAVALPSEAAQQHPASETGESITEEAYTDRAGAPAGPYEPRSARVEDRRRPRFQRPMRRGERRGSRPMRHGRAHERHVPQRRPQLIAEMLKPGQEIIVQIAKEPLGKKGARITSHVALPGRFLVYMPTVEHIGVSRKISSAEERSRLRRLLGEYRGKYPGGFIVRTAAGHVSEADIRSDVEFLVKSWHEIWARSEQRKAPSLLHRDLNLVERILRDYLNSEYSSIWIDSEEEFGKVVEFVNRFQPELANRVKLYTKDAPIFEEFGIQQELDKALRPKVWLKSGGYIVINHTEALVAIDVNTGKFVGRGSTRLEDTIVKTNLEAVKEIVRQIRLRDLGGIIVVDFIDMEERRNREKVMHALDEALRTDKAPSKVLAFNEFGLITITRKRTKQALERVLCQPCPYCTGSGMVKSIPTICYEIQTEARKMAGDLDSQSLTLRVNPEIAKALKTRESVLIEELEAATHKSVIIQADPALHWEQYDIF
jgi:Rne/Rng family ribonuclease